MFRSHKFIAVGMIGGCLMLTVWLPASTAQKIKMFIARLYSPAMRLTVSAKDLAGKAADRLKSRGQLLRENEQLRAELARSRLQLARADETLRENERLRQMLQFKNAAPRPLLAAQVIARDTSNWWKSIRIDRGSRDGVTLNAAVVTPEGIVGKIVEADKTESVVLMILDRSCKVSALLQPSREPAVVSGGVAELSSNPRCKLTFISKQAKIEPNAPVITSGMGGVFPAGYLIGTVAKQNRADDAGLYQEAEIVPAVNFRSLQEVFVILRPTPAQ
jgi:rod shape-determining protein MreC